MCPFNSHGREKIFPHWRQRWPEPCVRRCIEYAGIETYTWNIKLSLKVIPLSILTLLHSGHFLALLSSGERCVCLEYQINIIKHNSYEKLPLPKFAKYSKRIQLGQNLELWERLTCALPSWTMLNSAFHRQNSQIYTRVVKFDCLCLSPCATSFTPAATFPKVRQSQVRVGGLEMCLRWISH